MKTITGTLLKLPLALFVGLALVTGCEPRGESGKGETNIKTEKIQGKYADVNGIKMYYEIHSVGRPLVLLHAGYKLICNHKQKEKS